MNALRRRFDEPRLKTKLLARARRRTSRGSARVEKAARRGEDARRRTRRPRRADAKRASSLEPAPRVVVVDVVVARAFPNDARRRRFLLFAFVFAGRVPARRRKAVTRRDRRLARRRPDDGEPRTPTPRERAARARSVHVSRSPSGRRASEARLVARSFDPARLPPPRRRGTRRGVARPTRRAPTAVGVARARRARERTSASRARRGGRCGRPHRASREVSARARAREPLGAERSARAVGARDRTRTRTRTPGRAALARVNGGRPSRMRSPNAVATAGVSNSAKKRESPPPRRAPARPRHAGPPGRRSNSTLSELRVARPSSVGAAVARARVPSKKSAREPRARRSNARARAKRAARARARAPPDVVWSSPNATTTRRPSSSSARRRPIRLGPAPRRGAALGAKSAMTRRRRVASSPRARARRRPEPRRAVNATRRARTRETRPRGRTRATQTRRRASRTEAGSSESGRLELARHASSGRPAGPRGAVGELEDERRSREDSFLYVTPTTDAGQRRGTGRGDGRRRALRATPRARATVPRVPEKRRALRAHARWHDGENRRAALEVGPTIAMSRARRSADPPSRAQSARRNALRRAAGGRERRGGILHSRSPMIRW